MTRLAEQVKGAVSVAGAAFFALACAALFAGEAVAFAADAWAAAFPLAFAVSAIVFLIACGCDIHVGRLLAVFLLGLALAWRAEDARRGIFRDAELAGGPFVASVTVRDEPRVWIGKSGRRGVSIRGKFDGGSLQVIFDQPLTNALPRVGEVWKCSGWLSREGHRSAVRQLWVRGRGTHVERIGESGMASVWRMLARMRESFSRRMGIGLEDSRLYADMHRAMVLGERSALPRTMRLTFVAAGTVHVFAISGLHVMLVAKLLSWLCAVLFVPLRWRIFALLPLLWAYVLMIGAPPSAVRAAAMASIYYAAPLFRRRPDALRSWELVFFALAVIDPIEFFGVGSLLSFAVMLGILLFVRWERPMHSRALSFFGVPLAAWLAGMPLTAHFFARITPGGMLANVIMVPLAGMSVSAGVLGVAASFVSDALAAHCNALAVLFTQGMVGVSWAVSHLPWADLETDAWPVSRCIAVYAAIVLSFVLVKMVWTRRRVRV